MMAMTYPHDPMAGKTFCLSDHHVTTVMLWTHVSSLVLHFYVLFKPVNDLVKLVKEFVVISPVKSNFLVETNPAASVSKSLDNQR